MAGKKQLPSVRTVKDGEAAPPQSYTDSIQRGDRLDELKAMRRVLAAHIDNENTLARDLAALMRQAREISKEIEELEELGAAVAEDEEGQGGIYAVEDSEWRPEAI